MKKREIGSTGIQVSVIGLGCWPMGGDYWGGTDDQESIRTIHRALELGINLFDTAPGYGKGHSEEIVGKGLKKYRNKAIISTKVSGNLTPESIKSQLKSSLERLQTEYIDIYFIHWPNRREPLAYTMETLEQLRREGRIRAIGVSNFTVEMIKMALKYGQVDVVQPPYNLIWRFIEEDVLPYCRQNGISIMTYSSLAQGLLTGTLRLTTRYAPGDMRPRSVLWKSENFGKCLYTVERLKPIAQQIGASLSQLALNWLISQPGVTTSLTGARTVEEITENAGAADLDVSPQTMKQIQEISDELYYTFPYYYDMWENWVTWQRRGPQKEI
ncbi:MAG: aldo/keto reductase [Anaerolineae bacterium]|nr:aldo/keto reductase [Anaerolineae bacterium]